MSKKLGLSEIFNITKVSLPDLGYEHKHGCINFELMPVLHHLITKYPIKDDSRFKSEIVGMNYKEFEKFFKGDPIEKVVGRQILVRFSLNDKESYVCGKGCTYELSSIEKTQFFSYNQKECPNETLYTARIRYKQGDVLHASMSSFGELHCNMCLSIGSIVSPPQSEDERFAEIMSKKLYPKLESLVYFDRSE